MPTHLSRRLNAAFTLTSVLLSAACNSITGLNDFSVNDSAAVAECRTNSECGAEPAPGSMGSDAGPSVCVMPEGRCARLKSEDCTTITGDVDDDSIVIGSLFATVGAQAATNVQRQQSAILAVQQINAVGGVPAGSAGSPRKLVLVSCDAATHLMGAASHLVDDLHVPAIVGPNTSQDTLDVSNQYSVRGNTVLMSPTAVASSVAALVDNDLTWLMVPNDVQRAPLMISQIKDLETQLKSERTLTTVKLGVVFRDDALGTGTRTSLNALVLNGKPLSDTINFGKNVMIDPYDYKQADQHVILEKYLGLLPDIMVLAGTAEAVTNVMKPLEEGWPQGKPRPYYVLIDSVKVPDLISLVTGNEDLRRRVRGTGITPAPESAPVYSSFKLDYQVAFPGSSPNTSGMGSAYDATFAIAFAAAATHGQAVTGTTIASGLRRLAGGATSIEVGGTKALQAFQRLAAGEKIAAIGTFAPLDWDMNGAVVGGTLEMWCIGVNGSTPAYQSSGLTFDLANQQPIGQYTQCGP
jgi:ABC-type branched-subunit amino acid transport system substrate-binding protein